jgi:acyl-CoA thioesterase
MTDRHRAKAGGSPPAQPRREPHAPTADAQALAERVAAGMFAGDRASRALGMRIESVAPGQAEMTMAVRDDMLNGHAICHGGFIFLLADSTFAFACNSYNRNTVAQGCSIDYLAPAHAGDVLRAVAVERSRTGRTGVYDIDVRNQDGRHVALFRGKSYRIDGHVVDEPTAS